MNINGEDRLQKLPHFFTGLIIHAYKLDYDDMRNGGCFLLLQDQIVAVYSRLY